MSELSKAAGMELEEGYHREQGSGHGTESAYSVEARIVAPAPATIAGQLFDNRWRRVQFQQAAVGVPAAPRFNRQTLEHGYLGYAAAQALRWWLHATADAGGFVAGCMGLETRLIKHTISHSYKIEAVSVRDVQGAA